MESRTNSIEEDSIEDIICTSNDLVYHPGDNRPADVIITYKNGIVRKEKMTMDQIEKEFGSSPYQVTPSLNSNSFFFKKDKKTNHRKEQMKDQIKRRCVIL